MMPMQQTSLYAYAENTRQGITGHREMQVYEALKAHGALTNRQLMQMLNLPINCVTGRTRGLVKKGYVEKAGTTWEDTTDKPHILWRVVR